MDGHASFLIEYIREKFEVALGDQFAVRYTSPFPADYDSPVSSLGLAEYHIIHKPTGHNVIVVLDLDNYYPSYAPSTQNSIDAIVIDILGKFHSKGVWSKYAPQPYPPPNSNWRPAHDWEIDQFSTPPPIPPPPPLGTWQPPDQWHWDASRNIIDSTPTPPRTWYANNNSSSQYIIARVQDKLRYLQSLLQARLEGDVFYKHFPSSNETIIVELKGRTRSVQASITIDEVNEYPVGVMADIVAGRFYDVVNTVQQTQELDPQEEFGGPDWAEDQASKKGIVIKVQGWQMLNQVLEEFKSRLLEKNEE